MILGWASSWLACRVTLIFRLPRRDLPRVGDAFQLNVERIINLAPDRILAWQGGAPKDAEQARSTRLLGAAPGNQRPEAALVKPIATLGDALGQGPRGALIEAEFTASLNQLRARYAPRPTPRVFLQIAENQLFTVSDHHYMGEAVSVCGGDNLFSDAVSEVPVVTLESVLSGQPDVIVFVTNQTGALPWQAKWQTFLPEATIQRVESDSAQSSRSSHSVGYYGALQGHSFGGRIWVSYTRGE